MRAFILAAGEGTRMWPLTENRPKPLIPLANKPIIEHIMASIVDAGIDKISILIGYEGRKIIERYGYSYRDAKIDYLYQKERRGTGDAALYAEKYEDDEFLILNGDLLFGKDAIKKIVEEGSNSLLSVLVEDAESYGAVMGERYLEEIKEKEKGLKNAWINAGVYLLDRDIFKFLHKVKPSPRGEIELTSALNMMAKEKKIKIVRYKGMWMDIGRPWDLLNATELYLRRIDKKIEGEIDENVIIRGDVRIGKGTVVMSGTTIEGPAIIGENCKIGPNAYIRPNTVIGNNCHIGMSEVKASIIMDNSNVPHFNYVGDSIIGENCNLGAGTIVANLRLDEKNVWVYVKGKRENTGRRKLGVIMGDDVHTGINVSIDVGTMIGSGSFIAPGSVVRGIVKKRSRIF